MENPSDNDLPYTLKPLVSGEAAEWERLDAMHNGIATYFGDGLALVDTGVPKRILELGCGSGAWAIQAAKRFPEAEVVAVDIAPLPSRPVPANFKFQLLNLVEELPFTSGSFDVVHTRFVLAHLPNPVAALKRQVELVKPGGWFLIEDFDHMLYGDEMSDASKAFYKAVNEHVRSYGAEPNIGPLLEGMIRDIGIFGEIHVRRIRCPFSPGIDAEPKLRVVGDAMKRSIALGHRTLAAKIPLITDEMLQKHEKGVEDSSRLYTFDIYAVAARRL